MEEEIYELKNVYKQIYNVIKILSEGINVK